MVAENKYDTRTMKNEFNPPEPVENQDYYIDELYEYTVCIEVYVREFEGAYSEAKVCADAVHQFQNGKIDGDATVVNSEHMEGVEMDWDTDEPFDRLGWVKAKLVQMGVNAEGNPPRPHEIARPSTEKLLSDFR